MIDLLSRKDLTDLTGAFQKEKQCEVLQNAGIRFIRRADGWPILTKTALDNSLSPHINKDIDNKGTGFNIDAL